MDQTLTLPGLPAAAPVATGTDATTQLTAPTPLLDHDHPALQRFVAKRGWRALPAYERIGAVHDFVRDEIAFGYNSSDDLHDPPVRWRGQDTAIQRDGIDHDFGLFDSPDAFYARHGVNLSGFKRWLFRHVVRHRMNATVRRIRDGGGAAQGA